MLSENIRMIRKTKGLSQEELAVKLNVVRQTISKWEQGLSVPDADMLINISKALDTPIHVLLGETIAEEKVDDLKVISEKLEIINLQLSLIRQKKRQKSMMMLTMVIVAIIVIFALLIKIDSPYLLWDYNDPELAVVGVMLHAFEWIFIRISPIVLIVASICLHVQWKRK